MSIVPHKHTTKLFETPVKTYRHRALIAPASITGGKDTTKFGQKIEIKQTVDEFVAQEVDAIIDPGSKLSHAVKRFRAINKFKADKLYITPIQDDITGIKSTATITLDGTELSSAVKDESFSSMTNKSYKFVFDKDTTVDNVAIAIADKINENTSEFFTATASANVVTLTAVNAGTHLNGQPMDFSKFTLPGLDVIFSGFSGGANGADISTALMQYKNDSIDIYIPEEFKEAAIAHVQSKYSEVYTDAQKKGIVFSDSDMSLFDIAQSERVGNFFYVPFYNKAEASKLPAGTDGVYGATVQLDSYLAMVEALAYAVKKNQDGENTGRPAEDDYGIIGGVNQYLRTFNGTPLPSLPLSPFATMTSPTMAIMDEILIEKGFAYYYLDKLGQGPLLSELYISDASLKDSARRELCQYDIAEFLIEEYHEVLQRLSKLQQSKLISGLEAKVQFKNKQNELRALYPTIWVTDAISTLQKTMFDNMIFEIKNGLAFVDYSLVIDSHIRGIQSAATLHSQAQLS